MSESDSRGVVAQPASAGGEVEPVAARMPTLPASTQKAIDRQQEAYRVLFILENTIRGYIVTELQRVGGRRWWEQRLPQPVREAACTRASGAYRRGLSADCSCHPICYVDFPDLKTVLTKADNWRDCFRGTLGNAEHVRSELGQVEPIRNALAHGRYVSEDDYARLCGTWRFVSRRLPQAEIVRYVQTAVTPVFPVQCLTELRDVLRNARLAAISCQPYRLSERTKQTLDAEWFDPDILGVDLQALENACAQVRAYSGLPRPIGCGPAIRLWLQNTAYEQALAGGLATLDTILGG